MTIWLVMLAGGLLTYAMRLSFIILYSRWQMPEGVRRGLRFVPPAVLSAILVPDLLVPNGVLELSLNNVRLLAGMAAILVAWRTRNTLVTILAGMVILLLLGWLG
jgi:branched-subunit amino acid transport protein